MDFTVIADPQSTPRIPVTIEGDHIEVGADDVVAHQVFSVVCEGEELFLTRAQMEALLAAGPRILAQMVHPEPRTTPAAMDPIVSLSLFALAGVAL